MEDILNASLAGGVAVGASAGLVYIPAIGLGIGIAAGAVSTIGFHYVTPLLERTIGLYDTCGIHNLHGVPGVLGGVFSALVIWAYTGGVDPTYTSLFSGSSIFANLIESSDYSKQGGLQLAGTFTSLGLGLAFGVLTGVILNLTST